MANCYLASNPQVIGVCWKGPVPGLIISFWEPVLLVETVKNPGSTVIESIEPMIASAAKTAAKNALGSLASGISVTSGSGSSSFDQTNLQFSETHIYDFPFKDVITALFGGGDCPSTIGLRCRSEGQLRADAQGAGPGHPAPVRLRSQPAQPDPWWQSGRCADRLRHPSGCGRADLSGERR